MLPAADTHPRSYLTLRAFGWLFASLSLVALLSQPGATHDEWYHVSSIWCGHGERDPYCTEKLAESGSALINLDVMVCQRAVEAPLECPTVRSGQTQVLSNFGLYPKPFYFIMSWFVTPWGSDGVVLIRLVSALFVSLSLMLLFVLLPSRYCLVALIMILTTFSSTGFFLFSSVNPSSWAALGIGFGWLALHAMLSVEHLSTKRRAALGVVGLLLSAMAVGSRWDAPPFLAMSAWLVVTHALWVRLPQSRVRTVGVSLGLPIILLLLLQWFTPQKPLTYAQRLFEYSPGELGNVAFFSHYVLDGIPNALGALGTLPTMSGVSVPRVVGLIGIVVLSWFVVQTYSHRSIFQLFGTLVAGTSLTLAIMAQIASIDERDPFGVEPRYVYPALIFLVGWWVLLGTEKQSARIVRFLKPASCAVTVAFALTMFTVAERYVDAQTFGLRLLPEGPDQWWWQWMPVGPNTVVILAVATLWMFFRQVISDISRQVEKLSAP